MKKSFAVTLLVLCAQAPSAHADVICMKNSQKIKVASKQVNVKTASLLTTAATTCPSGYTALTPYVTQVTQKTSFTGVWNLSGAPGEGFAASTISFPEALSADPTQTIFVQTGTTNTTCTGSVTNPTAPAGKLCIYEASATNLSSSFGNRYAVYTGVDSTQGNASKYGAAMYGYAQNSGLNFYAWGTWAVTKP